MKTYVFVLIRRALLSNKVPHWAASNEYLQIAACFLGKNKKKYQYFWIAKKCILHVSYICIDIFLLSSQKKTDVVGTH